ncbi:glycosyltransferase involved in cell wall biosynthesis [Pseudomonas psychrotolerans]|nr:glycosyltransferase involved in cell wall biosynthesis [Pseudomonas psychrotolerans]
MAAFARGALPELLTAETGTLAPPGDVPALAVALREALSLSREACRARAEGQWSQQLMIDRYESLLAAVAAGRVARG